MISNQILQSTLDGLKGITRTELCVCDTEGKVVATTFDEAGDYELAVSAFVNSPAESQVIQGFQFFKIFDENQLEYILLAKGAGEDVYMQGKMAVFHIQGLLVAYKERFDRDNFIKNLLLDNLLLVDIYNRAKKLHIDINARRTVFVIETPHENDSVALECTKEFFTAKSKDFITAVDEKMIIIVKELRADEGYDDMEKIGLSLFAALTDGGVINAHIAYGTIVGEIKEVSRSYKEAKMALDVGKIFYAEKNVVAYNNLGIGRLIYQLPTTLCKLFLDEVFEKGSLDTLDHETIVTIQKFFEKNLNVSETSRQLYVHRNTLVYRLDKVQKLTGLDLRVFDDAIVFKVAMMVKKYLESNPNKI